MVPEQLVENSFSLGLFVLADHAALPLTSKPSWLAQLPVGNHANHWLSNIPRKNRHFISTARCFALYLGPLLHVQQLSPGWTESP